MDRAGRRLPTRSRHPRAFAPRRGRRESRLRAARPGERVREARRTGPEGLVRATSCPRGSTSASSSAVTAPSSTRCGGTRHTAPVFGINFGTIGFLATVERDELENGLERAFAGRLRGHQPARPRARHRRPSRARRQRRLVHPPRPRARGRAELHGRGSRGGARPLRRPRRRDPRRIDRLQPRQQRPHPGLGRGGLRRQLHRSAHAHRPRAGRRPGRRPARPQRGEPGSGRHRPRRRSRRSSCPGEEIEIGFGDGDLLAQLPGDSFYSRLREKFGRLAHWPPSRLSRRAVLILPRLSALRCGSITHRSGGRCLRAGGRGRSDA